MKLGPYQLRIYLAVLLDSANTVSGSPQQLYYTYENDKESRGNVTMKIEN